jgi:hypothetical protein
MLEYVDLETAKAARGVRMVTSGMVPSPWSEAAKGLFRVAAIPVLAVRYVPRDPVQMAWTQSHNTPTVFWNDDPPRTVWSQIIALAARLATPGALLPVELDRRVETIGLIHEIAGEDGLGWNARMMMIHASFTSDGQRGFAKPVAQYLAAKYGYASERIDDARGKAIATLAALAARLGAAPYFHGNRPGALDCYMATFLTPLTAIRAEDCPGFAPPLRQAFAAAREELAAFVPEALMTHRRRMYDDHLGWPIQL